MELKDIIGYLGIDGEIDGKEITLDQFKEKFKENYFTEEQVFQDKSILNKFTSKTLNSVEDNIMKVAKGYGVEFNKEDFKGKKTEEILDSLFKSHSGTHQEEVDKLKLDASKKGDDKYKSLNEDFTKAKAKITDLETLNKSTAEKLTLAEKTHSSDIMDFKKGYLKKEIFSDLKYTPDLDPMTKKGFISTMNEKYKLDFDEKGDSFITDFEGKRIENPEKHGTFLTPKEVYEKEGKEAKVISINPKAGEPVQGQAPPNEQAPPPANTPPLLSKRRLNPKAYV